MKAALVEQEVRGAAGKEVPVKATGGRGRGFWLTRRSSKGDGRASRDDRDLQIQRLAEELVTHPAEVEVLARIYRMLSQNAAASPYIYMSDAFVEQAADLRSTWEQVGAYLYQAMDSLSSQSGETTLR